MSLADDEAEPEAPSVAVDVTGMAEWPPDSPSNAYALFGAKNKVEIESQQPLSKLI